ncbi:unnamed protein product [Vitrella brassicaformis CCMP3155]|uniref:Secreted protein n=1 Tax=Vitrella brassicaformis (strain CCMP3155) TaxID=1169540 RepID=A0A0G4ESW4_VITBC|nr:unnamed protein product [Vitrella brassicaformis CCMP3155]|eukprot:CEM01506.1 unnamed protein product [Vitrella brassicaformis CCMP3155]
MRLWASLTPWLITVVVTAAAKTCQPEDQQEDVFAATQRGEDVSPDGGYNAADRSHRNMVDQIAKAEHENAPNQLDDGHGDGHARQL